MAEAKLWKSGYETPCQTYTCTRRAAWMIGANAETLGVNLFLCDACAESLFESMLNSELGKRVLERQAAKEGTTAPGRFLKDALGGFLADCCDFDPRYAVPVGDLYEAYVKSCDASSQEPLGKNGFGKLLRDRGLSQRRVGHGKIPKWLGVRLRSAEGGYL